MVRTLILVLCLVSFLSCNKDEEDEQKQFQKDIALIEAYLLDNGLIADRTASGLHYIITDTGSGTSYPGPNSQVTVGYKGYFLDGQVFDQSQPGQPISFFLNQVIKGWPEGMQLFRKGGKGVLLLPSKLAYGANPPSESIHPYAVMIFDVELVDF